MADRVFETFLEKQLEEATAFAAESDILDLEPMRRSPCPRYVASYQAKGLVQSGQGQIVEASGFAVGIWLPDDYLRRVEPAQVLTYLGPHRRPWHPNIRPPYICLHLRCGMGLVDLLYLCYELWVWQLRFTGDGGLNPAAAQWATHHGEDRFPIDKRPLKRRASGSELASCQEEKGKG